MIKPAHLARLGVLATLAVVASCSAGSPPPPGPVTPGVTPGVELVADLPGRRIYDAEGYGKVLAWCDGRNRVYLAADQRPVVVPNDNDCAVSR